MTISSIQPTWPAPAWIKAHTTVRNVWGDATQDYKNTASTKALVRLLNLPNDPCWIKQEHTAIVTEAKPSQMDVIADASFTTIAQRVCIVLTADCLPIFLCDRKGTKVAIIHAGWRGLAKDIVKTTVSALGPAADLLAWLGPAIGPEKFEVGTDVYDAFTQADATTIEAFQALKTEQKWLANLYKLAEIKLRRAGVTAIYTEDYCTHRDTDLFYSYRRDQGKTGRMASVIWINA